MRKALLILLTVVVFVACKQEPKSIQVASLMLNKTSVVIEAGNSITLTATVLPEDASDKTITWTSSDETIATVENGVVTGLKEGLATITVISCGGGR